MGGGRTGRRELSNPEFEFEFKPHSSLGTLTMDSFGLPSMCSSSLLSLISLHLTGGADERTGLEPGSEFEEPAVVIFIFLTVPKPGVVVGVDAADGVAVKGVVDDVEHGRVGERLDKGESALELDLELSEESLEEDGLIFNRSPPSIRKC